MSMNNKNNDISRVLVIGANGTIGAAMVSAFEPEAQVTSLSRDTIDYTEDSLSAWVSKNQHAAAFSKIICCIGTLHDELVQPEKNIKQVNPEYLQHYFYVNSIVPMLVIKHFSPLLSKEQASCFACLSAMVGSTQDNGLGGWYGYRASKAALNSLIKTASIELRRTHKKASLVAIHPGTTVGELTAPFAKNIDPEKYYTPEQSAQRIKQVMESVRPEQSGGFFNWDGTVIPW